LQAAAGIGFKSVEVNWAVSTVFATLALCAARRFASSASGLARFAIKGGSDGAELVGSV